MTLSYLISMELVDSQPAAIEATIQALSRFEVHVTAAEVREQFGGGSRKLVGYSLERALALEEAGQADTIGE